MRPFFTHIVSLLSICLCSARVLLTDLLFTHLLFTRLPFTCQYFIRPCAIRLLLTLLHPIGLLLVSQVLARVLLTFQLLIYL
jgi:hypothetical protein